MARVCYSNLLLPQAGRRKTALNMLNSTNACGGRNARRTLNQVTATPPTASRSPGLATFNARDAFYRFNPTFQDCFDLFGQPRNRGLNVPPPGCLDPEGPLEKVGCTLTVSVASQGRGTARSGGFPGIEKPLTPQVSQIPARKTIIRVAAVFLSRLNLVPLYPHL